MEGDTKMEENVEERVERYYKKAMELLKQQKYHKSIHYCQYCLNLIKRKPDNCLMVSEVLHTLASCYHRQGKKILKWIRKKREEEEEKAGVKLLHIAIHYYISCTQCSNDEDTIYWKSIEGLGNVHHILGNYEEAIIYHKKFLDYSIRNGDTVTQQRVNTNLGHAHLLLGDMDSSQYHHWQSLELSIYLRNHLAEAQCYYSLGTLHLLSKNYKEALKYFKKHLNLAQELNDKYGQCKSYWCIGKALTSLGRYESALLFANKQFLLAEEICDYSQYCTARRNMSDLLEALSRPTKKYKYSHVMEGHKKGKSIEAPVFMLPLHANM